MYTIQSHTSLYGSSPWGCLLISHSLLTACYQLTVCRLEFSLILVLSPPNKLSTELPRYLVLYSSWAYVCMRCHTYNIIHQVLISNFIRFCRIYFLPLSCLKSSQQLSFSDTRYIINHVNHLDNHRPYWDICDAYFGHIWMHICLIYGESIGVIGWGT